MVRGRILTAHPGGVHGDGGLPEVIPPTGKVPGHRLLAAPILKRQRRWYREEIGKKTPILGISSAGVIYRRRGKPRGPPGSQAPPLRGQTVGRATKVPGSLVVPSGPTQVIPEGSRTLIYYLIYPEFLEHFIYGGNLK